MLGVLAVPAILRAGAAAGQATCSIFSTASFQKTALHRAPPGRPGILQLFECSNKSRKLKLCSGSGHWLTAGPACGAWGEAGEHCSSPKHSLPRCYHSRWLCRQLSAGAATLSVQIRADKGSSESDLEETHAEQTTFSSLPYLFCQHRGLPATLHKTLSPDTFAPLTQLKAKSNCCKRNDREQMQERGGGGGERCVLVYLYPFCSLHIYS